MVCVCVCCLFVCVSVYLKRLRELTTCMPITGFFMELWMVFKQLITSLFLLLNLFQSLFRLLVIVRKQEKHLVVLAD